MKNGNGDLRISYEPLSSIQRWRSNPKDHSISDLAASMSRHGFTSPIIVDDVSGVLVAGHGRVDTLCSLKQQGRVPPRRIKINDEGEWLVPVIRGISFPTERDAAALAVGDNRLVELGGWLEPVLADVLSDLAIHDALEGVGYDQDDIDALVTKLQLDGDKKDEAPGEGAKESTVQCPKCQHEFTP